MAGFARHALGLGNLAAKPPSYSSYMSYSSYRAALWHVADVPGVQGELLPAGVWGSAPHLPISESAKISFVSFVFLAVEGLAFWACTVISNHSGSPAGGSRPLIGFNLRNRRFPSSQSFFVNLRGSSWFFVSAPQGKPSTLSQRPARRALAARSVLRSLFSVLCSLSKVAQERNF